MSRSPRRDWRHGLWWVLTALLVSFVCLLGVAPGPALADAPLSWAAPTVVDPTINSLEAIACPSASLCVAGDEMGNVFTATDPAGGTAAWTGVKVVEGYNDAIGGISCPSSALCAAAAGDGNVVTSTDPTGGKAAWTVTDVDESHPLNAISCPSAELCVAVERFGNAVTSTDPTGGASAWTLADIDGSNDLDSISCPSVSLCVATDVQGNVVTSTNPTGGASAWTVTNLTGIPNGENQLNGVSCPSVSLCVAVGGSGVIATSTDPNGGDLAWTITNVDGEPGGFEAVSCAASLLCVVTDFERRVATTTTPTGGAAAWTLTPVDPNGDDTLYAVSCQAETLCVVGDAGHVVVGTIGAQHELTVSLAGAGSGTVAGAGISCPGTCASSYANGTEVTLTATPAAGSTFAGWSGGSCSGTGACGLTMGTDKSVTATFALSSPAPAGALTISPTTVYSAASVECGGAKWSLPSVETQWLLDGSPIMGASSTTYVPQRTDDGHQLACRQTGSAEGLLQTLTSPSRTIYEQPPSPGPDINTFEHCSAAACVENEANLNPTYEREGSWYSSTPIGCSSGAWTSDAGVSILPGISALADAHTVRVTLQRATGTGFLTLATLQVGRLQTARDEAFYESSSPFLILVSYGSQLFTGAEAAEDGIPALAGHPIYGAAGQGYFQYDVRESIRDFRLTYNLTQADLGTHVRCLIEADDGPLATPTTAVYTTAEATISTKPICAPLLIAPGNVPKPTYVSAGDTAACLIPPAPAAKGGLFGETLTLPIIGATADVAFNCNLPGGCNGTLSLIAPAGKAAAARRHRAAMTVLASTVIRLRRGSRHLFVLKLNAAGRRLLARAGATGLAATLQLEARSRKYTIANVQLIKGARR